MLNSSNFYNLSNPGLNTDIGDGYFRSMYPQQFMDDMPYIPGVTGSMDGIHINGQLSEDTFDRGCKGGTSLLAKIVLGTLTLGVGLLCLKGIKTGAGSLWNKITGNSSNAIANQQNNNVTLWERIKGWFKKKP